MQIIRKYSLVLGACLFLCRLVMPASCAFAQLAPSLRDSISSAHSGTARINALLAAGKYFQLKPGELQPDMDSAANYFEKARQLATRTGNKTQYLEAQFHIASLHQELKMPWITAQMATTLLPRHQVHLYNHLSIFYRVKPGEFADDLDSSLLYGQKALAVAQAMQQEEYIQSAATVLAASLLERGELKEAVNIAQKLSPASHANILQMAGHRYYFNHNRSAGEKDSGEHLAREAIQMATALALPMEKMVGSNYVLGYAALDRGQLNQAAAFLPLTTGNFKGNLAMSVARRWMTLNGMHDSAAIYARLALQAYEEKKNDNGIQQAQNLLKAVEHIHASLPDFKSTDSAPQRFRKLIDLGKKYQSGFPAFDLNQLNIAANYFNHAIHLADSMRIDKYQIEAWTEMGKTYCMMNEAGKARQYYDLALARYAQKNNMAGMGYTWLHYVNNIRRKRPNYGLVAESFGKASYYYSLAGDMEMDLKTGMEQANYLQEDGRPAEANAVLIRLSRKYAGNQPLAAYQINQHLARLAQFRGDLSAALRYAISGLRQSEAMRDTAMQKVFLNRLADIYYDLGQFDKSIAAYHQVVQNEHNKGILYDYFPVLSLTELLIRHRTAAEALAFVKGVYRSDPPVGYYAERILQCAQALCYQALGQPDEANRYFSEALQDIDKISVGDRFYTLLHFNAGKFFLEQQKFSLAADHLRKSIRSGPDVAGVVVTHNAQYLLFRCDSALGNYRQAIGHYQLYKYFTDSLFNVAKSRQISELQIQYETEKKDQSLLSQQQEIRFRGQEIEILTQKGKLQKADLERATLLQQQAVSEAKRKDQDIRLKEKDIAYLRQEALLQETKLEQERIIRNVSFGGGALLLAIIGLLVYGYCLKQQHNRSLQNKQVEIGQKNLSLEKLLHEKEWLLKEIHHRVKNNLQIVMSLLNSQGAYLQNDAALVAIRDSQHRVQAISLIHKKLYQSDNVGVVYMPHYIHELVDYLTDCFDTGKKVRFLLDVAPLHLDVSQAVPLGLILNEAITNAIKYAFPGDNDGEIQITFENTGGESYALHIADNGIGLPAGFDAGASRSLGLSLMEGLSADLGARFSIQSHFGTEIHIAFTIENFIRPELPPAPQQMESTVIYT
ncbi:histidine kinase dimerization/phosphoacceptor domain -containing protein [Chitinophaga sp.]|uniref:histidine kinase dimerization/phosphoacceptor domain -containing protein n=1 Tax=Chitinophaga sp. TaxID=1869181 RepID=UPI00260B8387|nr:histidine kinase dimerization/phosphoacceptor domain -containing protein [uncultured Chitinophaga sp.]